MSAGRALIDFIDCPPIQRPPPTQNTTRRSWSPSHGWTHCWPAPESLIRGRPHDGSNRSRRQTFAATFANRFCTPRSDLGLHAESAATGAGVSTGSNARMSMKNAVHREDEPCRRPSGNSVVTETEDATRRRRRTPAFTRERRCFEECIAGCCSTGWGRKPRTTRSGSRTRCRCRFYQIGLTRLVRGEPRNLVANALYRRD